MARAVTLLLGVHAHQPAGNFREVVDDAHARCYRPFLHILHRYPDFRFAIHVSGWLLGELQQRFPKDVALLGEMVARGQVELFGGGDTEPVLAAIPARDRRGQLDALSERLHSVLGARPEGAWLTERVWEATVVPELADAGIGFVTVDDYHFLCAGRTMDELSGYFSTEDNDRRLDLFPISEALRYRIPFAPASEAIAYLESLAGADGDEPAAVYFDDIEKFGIWPETHRWVYEERWLEQFIEGVLASPVLSTGHYGDYRRRHATRGVVYLPTTSYIEMNEWTLPPQAAQVYSGLVEQERAAGRYDQARPFVRGGIWRNFFSRYPESNWMHKRMLSLSRRLDALPSGQAPARLRELLYLAQANDAYWHGLFGGLYLPHLRRGVYNALVELERALDLLQPRVSPWRDDLDLDGRDEVFLHNHAVQVVVRDDEDAAVLEFDAYALAHNFGDTLTRRTEHYNRKLTSGEQDHSAESGIASPHDRVSFRHQINPQDLLPDPRPRRLFLDTWHPTCGENGPAGGALAPEYRQAARDQLQWQAATAGGSIEKSYRLDGEALVVSWRFLGLGAGEFETRVDLALPSCDGFLGRVQVDGTILGGFGSPLTLPSTTGLTLDDGVLGGTLSLDSSRPVAVTAAPHFTVSQSEAGFEKIMQAFSLQLRVALSAPEESLELTLRPRPTP